MTLRARMLTAAIGAPLIASWMQYGIPGPRGEWVAITLIAFPILLGVMWLAGEDD